MLNNARILRSKDWEIHVTALWQVQLHSWQRLVANFFRFFHEIVESLVRDNFLINIYLMDTKKLLKS